MKGLKPIKSHQVVKLFCDSCGQQASKEESEFYEFISIDHQCGYGSIHGDGNRITIDLCQQCFADMCGDSLAVIKSPKEAKNWDSYFDQEPTVSDDFMSDRGDIVEVPNVEPGKASEMLSDTPINPKIDDDNSRQSSIEDDT